MDPNWIRSTLRSKAKYDLKDQPKTNPRGNIDIMSWLNLWVLDADLRVAACFKVETENCKPQYYDHGTGNSWNMEIISFITSLFLSQNIEA